MARNTYNEDESLEQGFNKYHLKRLMDYARPYNKTIILSVVLMIFASCLSLLAPYFIKIALDDMIPNGNVRGLVIISGLFALTLIIGSIIMAHRIKAMGEVGQNMLIDMRHDLFVNLQKLPFTYYDNRPHGKILVRVVNYINSLSDLLSNGFINLVADIVTVLTTIAFMFALNAKLTLISLLGIPLLILIMIPLKNAQRKAYQKLSTKQSNMNAYVHESISGIRVTQSFAREEENRKTNEEVCSEYSSAWLGAVRVMFLVWPAMDFVATLAVASIYFVAVFWMDGAMSIGLLVAFVGYVWRFWGPITNMSNFYNNIINCMAYLERIFELMDEEPTIKDEKGAYELPHITGEVTFEHVSFAYEEDQPILKDITFTAQPGERVAIVGPTGSGKTTIINLISRFYDINGGKLTIDGHDVRGVTLQSLREQMGIMLQDSFIFSGTIKENIRYGKLDATDDEIIAAAKVVGAHDFIVQFEEGYDTEVNERGSRLSVGQRQLISFARTLLANPKILILDEATSSIDSETEILLQKGLDELLKGRTSFIIAHRLSTIKNSNKILYIEDGYIVEEGSHDVLIDKKGAYHELYSAQFKWLNAIS
ncbi:MAG: ABC transporter ATP-binding protein [Cellulosilyticaceae bacterium]